MAKKKEPEVEAQPTEPEAQPTEPEAQTTEPEAESAPAPKADPRLEAKANGNVSFYTKGR